ncbi:MAG: phosphotransferase [Actinomycetota bacterium]|nr:phosphotransferase [Actinomycetota bacterium]
MELIDSGWDSRAWLVEGRWIDREPRRPEVAQRLLTETRLLPWLAPQLPVRVPVPHVVSLDPLRVRHELVPGTPLCSAVPGVGTHLGGFLTAQHTADVQVAVEFGVPDAAATAAELAGVLVRMRQDVLPRLPDPLQVAGAELLDALAGPVSEPVLVHGDLGPEHILVTEMGDCGVIDWGDACIADPALDLAWLLYGAPAGVAREVERVYDVTPRLRARALLWHQLGPWHEVLYGLDTGRAAYVDSGLEGVCSRLTLDG